ncbi:MAG: FKBP-type peptidyl-prolyl cis-trans isomerase [Bacteroidales bacterium]|jgi:hypothetical protein|nr:FKBP-type peptidyl-prolyl cis-trans isomerase [Bacteroidales bacterium]
MKQTSLTVTILCLIAFVFSACGDKRFKDYEKTETGLYYKFTERKPEGKQPQQGDFLSMTVSYKSDNDSIPPFEKREIMNRLMESMYPGDINEAYAMLREGEEAEFVLRADSFFIAMFGKGNLPEFITPENVLYFTIRMNKITTMEEFEQEEVTAIQNYITANNITVEPTSNGLYYIETAKGKGTKVEDGKQVSVHYTGKFLDGSVFDSSVQKGEPMTFIVGGDPIIPGFVEGILLMNQGGKATFIIPSELGYGMGNQVIPPFTPLLFEVEIVEVLNQ